MHAKGQTTGTGWVDKLDHDQRKILREKWTPDAHLYMLIAPGVAASGILECQQPNKDITLTGLPAPLPVEGSTYDKSTTYYSAVYVHSTMTISASSISPRTSSNL